MKPIITTEVDELGRVGTKFDLLEMLNASDKSKMMLDVYFAFVLKTIIDDFGNYLVQGTNGKVNKEQFEASLIENLNEMLPQNTRIKE